MSAFGIPEWLLTGALVGAWFATIGLELLANWLYDRRDRLKADPPTERSAAYPRKGDSK